MVGVEDGCEIVELMSPVRVDAGTDKPIRLVVQPQMPGLYRGGRPGAKPTSAEETAFECDFLIEAIGQVIEYIKSFICESVGKAINIFNFIIFSYFTNILSSIGHV